MEEIEKYLESYFGISGNHLAPTAGLFTPKTLKKNDFFLKSDQYSKNLGFLSSGFLRFYAFADDGEKEITQWISGPGAFVTELSSFMFNTPSRWNIQALSDCEIYTISKENYQNIGQIVENWGELEKLFLAKCFVTLENRVFNQLSMTAEQKVEDLLQMNPGIFLQVPLQYIASMLGMTPETLSRVRKKMVS